MSNVNDYEQEPQSPDEPPASTPRGGGDLSGKGISWSPDEDKGDEAGGDEAPTGSDS